MTVPHSADSANTGIRMRAMSMLRRPSLKILSLFVGIATVPVIELARTANREAWAGALPIREAALMITLVSLTFFGIAMGVRRLNPDKQRAAVSVVGWFALAFLHANVLRNSLPTGGWVHPWQWALVSLGMIGAAIWIGLRFDADSRFLATFVSLLVGAQLIMFVVESARISDPPPAPVMATAVDLRDTPSVWVILLDSHASPRSLREFSDIDLAEPLERLEGLGFRVWDDARANSPTTMASVPSLLSGQAWSATAVNNSYAELLVGLHGTTSLVAAFADAGHTIRMIPANWSRSQCGELVDDCFGGDGYDDHWYFLLRRTTLPDIFPSVLSHPWPIGGLRSLAAIKSLARDDEEAKHFTFVHSLASHPPTVIGENCARMSAAAGDRDNQLRCTHETLLDSLGSLDLEKEIVIIAADHGYWRQGARETDPATWSDATIREGFSAFTAVSTPRGCEDALSEHISGAQILPLILNCYGADLPVPEHLFNDVRPQPWGGVTATELDWDGWSTYAP